MHRLVGILAIALCALPCSVASAQHRGPSLFGFGIGIGNYSPSGLYPPGVFDPYAFDGRAYDPYRYGSFKAPDLLDDPYFRERHRYDSHFPGRYRGRVQHRPLELRRAAPVVPAVPSLSAVETEELVSQLESAAQRLSRGLATLEYQGEWIDYLRPEQIARYIDFDDIEPLRQLITRYDLVATDPDLLSVAALDGFSSTRSLLRRYLESTGH